MKTGDVKLTCQVAPNAKITKGCKQLIYIPQNVNPYLKQGEQIVWKRNTVQDINGRRKNTNEPAEQVGKVDAFDDQITSCLVKLSITNLPATKTLPSSDSLPSVTLPQETLRPTNGQGIHKTVWHQERVHTINTTQLGHAWVKTAHYETIEDKMEVSKPSRYKDKVTVLAPSWLGPGIKHNSQIREVCALTI